MQYYIDEEKETVYYKRIIYYRFSQNFALSFSLLLEWILIILELF